jgi:hypothetical protein
MFHALAALMLLQDIDNFGVERAILDAIRKDPQALALIDEVRQLDEIRGLAVGLP